MNEVFDFIECRYPLRNELRFKSRNIRTVRCGIETAAFVGSRIWTNMPNELKASTSLNYFKSKIKTWKPENCPCKLWKIYLQRTGYVQTFKLLISICSQMLLFMFRCFFAFLFFFFFIQVSF